MNEVNERVRKAIFATTLGAMTAMFDQRNPNSSKQMGSKFATDLGPMDLLKANWELSLDKNIKAPAVGFRTLIPGFVGVRKLSQIIAVYGPEAELQLLDGHKTEKNPRGSGYVECVWKERGPGDKTRFIEYTTLLIGPSGLFRRCRNTSYHDSGTSTHCSCERGFRAQNDEVVWTVFPGPAIVPSMVMDNGLHGRSITAATARELGFEYVKLA